MRDRSNMTGIGTATDKWSFESKFDDLFKSAASRLGTGAKSKQAKKDKKKKKKKKGKKRKPKEISSESIPASTSDPDGLDRYAGAFSSAVMLNPSGSTDKTSKKSRKKSLDKSKSKKKSKTTMGLYSSRSRAKLERLARQERLALEAMRSPETKVKAATVDTVMAGAPEGPPPRASLTAGSTTTALATKKKKKAKKKKKEKRKRKRGADESNDSTKTKKKSKLKSKVESEAGDDAATAYRRRTIRANFERKIQTSKKQSAFNAAGGAGFTMAFQADYYEKMMGSRTKRGIGLGCRNSKKDSGDTPSGGAGGLGSMFVEAASL